MNTSDAAYLARSLMREHGLQGWTFQYDRALRRFGLCSYNRKVISLSEHLTRLNSEAYVKETILHEIAHALCGPGKGHGAEWRTMARRIGCSGARCHTAETPTMPHKGICPVCNTTILRHRRRRIACTRCCVEYNGGKFDAQFLFEWYPNRIAS